MNLSHPKDRQEDQYLRSTGPAGMIHYELSSYGATKIEWVSRETDVNGAPVFVRTPAEKTVEINRLQPFTLAGKSYWNISRFIRHNGDGNWATDIHGRKVLCLKERFPCFDSYDFLNETRYYRWFFLRDGNSLHRVFVTDERKKVYVTEDVASIEYDCWEQMQKLGFCQQNESE